MDIQCIYVNAMEVNFLYNGQRFVWDSERASSNSGKHGVSFEVACEVFFDRFIHIEEASVEEENRDAAIGMTEDWMLFLVVHIQREGGTIRIISVPVTAQERRSYEDG
ncbi:MAG: BrnT family toxin [Terracidiphilus sp.]